MKIEKRDKIKSLRDFFSRRSRGKSKQKPIKVKIKLSGFGRYDVCIELLDKSKEGIVIELKVFEEMLESENAALDTMCTKN